jgi:pyrroline-5-carboxylate reductase
MRTAFIGGGIMAEAIISRAIAQGIVEPGQITVAEPLESRRRELAGRHGVTVMSENLPAISDAEMVILSIKPQHLEEVLAGLNGHLTPEQTVLSVVAGAALRTLVARLRHQRVVRVMPNTPARIGAGISAWTATAEVDESARESAAALLGTMGRQVYVQDEAYMDMATAVSGSGPAYVFSFMEALIEAAVYLGLPREVSRELVLETVLGSALLAKETGQHLGQLREMVTSPGGTTSEALLALEEGGFRASVMNAVVAAYEKAQVLGEET